MQSDPGGQHIDIQRLSGVVEQTEQMPSGGVGQRPVGQLVASAEEMRAHVFTRPTIKTVADGF
jgi:hypothetical protein